MFSGLATLLTLLFLHPSSSILQTLHDESFWSVEFYTFMPVLMTKTSKEKEKKKTEKKNSGTLHFECKLTEHLLFLVQLVHLYLKVTNYSRYNWHEQCTHFKIISISLCFSQWLKVENQDLSRQLAELQKLDSQDRFVNELIPIGTHFSNSSSINLPPLEMPQIQLPPKLSSDSEDDLSDRI